VTEEHFGLADLRTYQRIGVEFLLREEGALLADEMGTGKTVQAACALQVLRERGQLNRGLIVVPASLKLNWHRELRKWAPDCSVRLLQGSRHDRQAWYKLPFHLLIASYEQIRADFEVYPPDVHFDVVVLDEAQRVKDWGNSTTLAVSRITRDRLWALTGTPLENRVDELQTLIRLIRPGLTTDASQLDVLEALQGHFLRRKKSDVLRELPEIVDQTQLLELSSTQRDAYEGLWGLRGTGPTKPNLLAVLTRLKQVCNYCVDTGESSKLDALVDLAENVCLEGGKLLVFSQYVETLKWLEPRLPFPSGIYHGGLSGEDRERLLDDFATGDSCRALLVSLRAGGVGINVPDATHVVIFDRWWNPAVEDQAVHRAHRFGREGPLVVYRFLTVDTVEERIEELLSEKRALFDVYVEGAADEAHVTQIELKRILDLINEEGT